MSGVEKFKARLGANIQESMGGTTATGAGGPLPGLAHRVPGRYDGVSRPREALTIPVNMIRPDLDQPRKDFDPNELAMLAGSLKARGQLQPIRVRYDEGRGGWTIISGERRLRAAIQAGWKTVPVRVREADLRVHLPRNKPVGHGRGGEIGRLA